MIDIDFANPGPELVVLIMTLIIEAMMEEEDYDEAVAFLREPTRH